MTETEWLTCDDLRPMLTYLEKKGSDRKMRLFICACCRMIWEALPDGICLTSVETGEAFADGMVDDAERIRVFEAVGEEAERIHEEEDSPREHAAPEAAAYATCKHGHAAALAWSAALMAASAADNHGLYDQGGSSAQLQCLRDIVLFPDGKKISMHSQPSQTIIALARAAYEDQNLPTGFLEPANLAVLADALEDAGLSNELVAHLRSPGPHFRGCWAIDFCLGLT